ncbi:MAG: hypothetical protein UW51_C0018G0009 [Candidatus Amesbacteria bacterium GW2011_GWA1_44_24]|nr:MAG: hypothetical protein UW51_C0018G0009 [Candidatus Amesbacteria bacterium GW2011_GWA1_44_24]
MNTAQTKAKQIAQNEPWEILKEAGRQITGEEQIQEQEISEQQIVNDNSERDKVRSQRLMQALQTELDEIKKKTKKIVKAAAGTNSSRATKERCTRIS